MMQMADVSSFQKKGSTSEQLCEGKMTRVKYKKQPQQTINYY